jgi:MoaA/NifB/PqqE/SkfB family radical SAM enzyme
MKYITPAVNIVKMLLYDHLQIEPTTRCNLTCKTCPHKDGVPIVDITPETLEAILRRHHHIRQVNLQGLGEPFMHPDFENVCRIAKQYSFDVAQTFTNGTIIKWKAIDYLDQIVVSLDTLSNETARSIKGAGYNLSDVLYNIITLSNKIPTTVNFTQSIYNYNELDAVKRWCSERNIQFNVTRVQNWYAPDDPPWKQQHDEVMKERKVFGQLARMEPLCQWKRTRWYYYRADGVRNPCCRRMGYREYTKDCCRTCPD